MDSVYQIKVEYGHERWINFFVDASNVYSGQYRFGDLVSDIVRRCPSLSHLTEYTIRIRYEDDEGSYVNLVFGDECGFRDVWANAKRVPDREYRRLKIKVSEMNSPCGVANVEKTSSLVAKQSLRPSQRSSTSTIQPRQLYSFSIDETDKSYEELFSERGKKMKGFSDDSDSDSEISELATDKSTIKTPLQRLFEGMEKTVYDINNDIATKTDELESFKDEINVAHDRNGGVFQMCGQCHLRDGHTKRNCKLGVCLSAKTCGHIDKHPVEKARVRKLETEVATLQKKLKKTQENYKTKKAAYSKVNDSFAAKVEQDLISTNPQLYIQNGCKNWALVHKHVAILEKKCKGKLPKRCDIPDLLGNTNYDRDFNISYNDASLQRKTAINPAKATLEQRGIVFPNCVPNQRCPNPHVSSTWYRCIPSNEDEEREQLNMMLKQSMFENSFHNVTSGNPMATQQSNLSCKPTASSLSVAGDCVSNETEETSSNEIDAELESGATSHPHSKNEEIEKDTANVLLSLMGLKNK